MNIKQLTEKFVDSLVVNREKKILLVIGLFFIIFLIFKGSPVVSWGPSNNYENVSVRTTVNVTNSYPEIINITCNNGTAITLTAGGTYRVDCLVEIRDFNGGGAISNVNGTFYYYLNDTFDSDDNNTHYTNNSCSQDGAASGYFVNWTCSFDVWYYALNGTWIMNSTVNDTFGVTDTDSGNTSISPLLALNVTNVIDFGDLAVTQTSSSVEANVTNFGNVPINVSVFGFGSNDSVSGAGFAMLCTERNLTLPNERYDLSQATPYNAMTRITGGSATVSGLTVAKQVLASTYSVNSTYWRLYINLSTNPFGICNGTVVFAAESP